MKDCPITLSDESFITEFIDNSKSTIKWDDIEIIKAYKVDNLVVDDVRFAFNCGKEYWIEVSEDQPGFQNLIKVLEENFPSIKGWEDVVILPPFERNETVLFKRT